MMSASLEHHSVADDNSSLVDTLLVKIKQSSFPKDHRTPEEFEYIQFNVSENELDEFETTIMASTYLRVVH